VNAAALLPRPVIRLVATSIQAVRRAVWSLSRQPTNGVHAVALTPEGRVVLVRLTYAKGWRLPGGGRGRGEDPQSGVLRELREEIGLTGYGSVERVDAVAGELGELFLVTGVRYVPRRSFEIDDVGAFDPAALPAEAAPITRANLAKVLGGDAAAAAQL
jgi:8-oxo-dGTP pyrophosphatase MutT (NUDIX family)